MIDRKKAYRKCTSTNGRNHTCFCDKVINVVSWWLVPNYINNNHINLRIKP